MQAWKKIIERAYKGVQKAKALLTNCTEKEKDLINALSFRYAEKPTRDRNPLDIAYSKVMKKVYDKFSSDPDVGALYAESLMDSPVSTTWWTEGQQVTAPTQKAGFRVPKTV